MNFKKIIEFKKIEPGSQVLHCLGSILYLRSLILHGYSASGRDMGDSHCTLRFIYTLPSSP